MRAQQVLECVQADLVLFDVAVHEHHRLDPVVDAVAHKVELKNELLAKYESKVGSTQKSVQEWIILLDHLVHYVLEDSADFGHLENFEAPLDLHFLVCVVVESSVLHGAHAVGVLEATAELAKHLVAGINHEPDVRRAALLTEQEDKPVVEAEPVEKHH